ncbi:DUF3530 family protein [Shewanella marina]|uniref:DUF3530 family protein n=1 Tax=Shewanella marina TaxID=487319 RepID=UPI00046ED9D8|nr:DUF3530 family protein [Shewanella marina]
MNGLYRLLLLTLFSGISFIAQAQTNPELQVSPWQGKQQFGSVFIISAPKQPILSQSMLGHIQQQLPTKGWASIAITPPLNINSEPAAQQSWLQQALTQMQQASHEYTGKKVLIIANQSAAMAVEYFTKQQDSDIDLLVLIDPFDTRTEHNRTLLSQLDQLTLPVLDIANIDAHPIAQNNYPSRYRTSSSADTANYRLMTLTLQQQQMASWQTAVEWINSYSRKQLGLLSQ